MKKLKLVAAIGLLFLCSNSSLCAQSFTPGALWPDNNGVHINAHGGGILYDKGVYYWFGEHKTGGEAGNLANVGVHCYSSKDLYNWTDQGIVLSVVEDDPGHDITKGCILERPKVIYNPVTKKYVMWFHLELKGEGYLAARSGVAVSDRVTGPYKFLNSFRTNVETWPVNVLDIHKNTPVPSAKERFSVGTIQAKKDTLNLLGRDFKEGQMARDMNLFVDDDGKAYHIFASEENSTIHISELNRDFTGYSGKYGRFFVGRFMEAPAMFKKDGKYYLIMSGCSGWNPNAARSAVASSIWGEWKELGNPCIGNDAQLTFHSQSTYVLPVQGKKNRFIYMGDRWTPENAIDGRYIWLPIRFEGERPIIEWKDSWSLNDL